MPESHSQPPDIYYIILDAYSRDDVLKDFYNYDNSSFLSEVEGLGFYVARCSRSNYASTRLSLPSSLNMDYIDNLMKFTPEDPYDRLRAAQLIKVSQVRRELEALGYQTVGFESGYPWAQLENADFYISTRSNELGDALVTGGLNRFEELLLRTTAGLALVDGAKIFVFSTRVVLLTFLSYFCALAINSGVTMRLTRPPSALFPDEAVPQQAIKAKLPLSSYAVVYTRDLFNAVKAPLVAAAIPRLERRVEAQELTPAAAAREILGTFLRQS